MSRRSPFRCVCPDCGRHDGNPHFIFAHMLEHSDDHPGELPWMRLSVPRVYGWYSETAPDDADALVADLDVVESAT